MQVLSIPASIQTAMNLFVSVLFSNPMTSQLLYGAKSGVSGTVKALYHVMKFHII